MKPLFGRFTLLSLSGALLLTCARPPSWPDAGRAGSDSTPAADGAPPDAASAEATAPVPTRPIDLRDYFPAINVSQVYRKADGSLYSNYRYFPATTSFQSLYDSFFSLGKPGALYIWSKGYGAGGCIATYAHLFFGSDQSVTEVGDYYANDGCNPSVAFGYGDSSGANDGLAWSGPGGLRRPGGTAEPAERYGLTVRRQNNPGDPYLASANSAWNKTAILEVLPTYTPPYGRSAAGVWGQGFGKEYSNVLRVVFWHGTRIPGQTDIVCPVDPTWPPAGTYFNLPTYHSYASEFYLAPGKWIIQETLLSTEDGSYWGIANCVGYALDKNPAWISYIDEP